MVNTTPLCDTAHIHLLKIKKRSYILSCVWPRCLSLASGRYTVVEIELTRDPETEKDRGHLHHHHSVLMGVMTHTHKGNQSNYKKKKIASPSRLRSQRASHRCNTSSDMTSHQGRLMLLRHCRPLMGVMTQTHQGIEAVIKKERRNRDSSHLRKGAAVTLRTASPPIIAPQSCCTTV